MKKLYIFSILIGLLSCNEEISGRNNDVHGNTKVENKIPKLFSDVIPENAPDSTKVNMIDQLISDIDLDSSLIEIKTVDSLEIPIVGYFRNDSLVKIVKGNKPFRLFDSRPKFTNYRYNSYYFLMDTLIYSKSECNNFQHTGSCNSVYISIDSYYYNGRIISEIIDDQIGQFWRCGCGIPPNDLAPIDRKTRKSINYQYIEGLKELINTAKRL